ncbi:MAG: hypothetical protein IIT61_03215 [Bacteroidales bacterium]|nr:hypothetical protein [Bacteroidales bacterium]MBQ2351230.1 hypothetical protein [Bacteroidales bacterium]MBQ5424925.1 hypothetical protein [Bacteroidales bacterium]MBQ5457713.1 hypothetical protein [Bacteroidales bacterium]
MSDNIKKLFLDAENQEIKYGDSSELPQLALDTATSEIKYATEGPLPEGVQPMGIDLDTNEFAYGELEPVASGWYGVKVDETNTDPAGAVARIASDMTLHASLPIQSGMRRCVLNSNGTVNYYLDAADSTLKADGTAAVLDGTDGDVMVEIPEHWVLVTKEDTTLTVKFAMAEGEIEGAQRVPQHYISAYQATINNFTNKLRSVSGEAATSNETIGTFRDAASAKTYNGEPVVGWSQMTYDYAVDLYWLFLVEYANRNSQAAVNNSLTPEGYRQGGLGMGCTYVDSISNYPAVTNGVTNSLGNNSGEISGVTPLSGSGTATVSSYHGIENSFGNLYTFYDGIVNIYGNIYRAADIDDYKSFFYEETGDTTMDYAGGEVIVTPDGNGGYLYYLCVAPSKAGDKLSDDTKFEPTDMATLGYTLDAEYAEDVSGCLFTINNGASALGSMLAETAGGKSFDTNYCDYSDVYADSLCCVYGGGYADDYADGAPNCGLACVDALGFGSASVLVGSRLCYTNAE